MTDMEPRENGIDSLLRSSMAAPVPRLSQDFDQRLMRKLRQGSQPRNRYRRILIAGYGLTSVVASAVLMRGQGMGWGSIAVMTLAPIALVAVVPWMRRVTHATSK